VKQPKLRLGVNIDHIATLRQARLTRYPDPIHAAFEAEQGGADLITLHLREDRRHIQERDLQLLKETCQTRINLEMAVTADMLVIANKIQPNDCCLVPEKRHELTTEGGLDVHSQLAKITHFCAELKKSGIKVSLFIDPDVKQIDAAIATGAPAIEIHTGKFAEATTKQSIELELNRIRYAAEYAYNSGMEVHAGHGLNYQNVGYISEIPTITELNIGHAIIARALISGLRQAVMDMKQLMLIARS
jgi:pyridoxine 5-phosphate synthase